MSKRKCARIRKGRSTSKIRSKAAAAGSPTITKRERIRAALRRDGARACPVAQARAHGGWRRDCDQRAGQELSVHGAPAGRRSHTPLTRYRGSFGPSVAKVVPAEAPQSSASNNFFDLSAQRGSAQLQ
jgi:hypothetical protein